MNKLYGYLFLALAFQLVCIIDSEIDIDNSYLGLNRILVKLFIAFTFDYNKLLFAFVFFFIFPELFNASLLHIIVC